MAYVLDSNILLRAVEKNSVDRPVALSAIKKLLERDERVVLFPQIIVEFWVVATRPTEARGGLGFSTDEAEQLLRDLPSLELCPESDRIFPEWQRLVKLHRVRGTLTPVKSLLRRTTMQAVIEAVEGEKEETWERFRERHNDWGRDLVLWLGRRPTAG